MKKLSPLIGFVVLFFGTTQLVLAQNVENVTLLEGIGNIAAKTTPTFGAYLENGYRFAIGAAGVIAVVQLVVAGIEYIYFGFSEGSISKAKARAINALYGLLGVLLTYVILQIINPGLVANGFNVLITPLSEEIRAIPTPPAGSTGGGSSDTGQGSNTIIRSSGTGQGIVRACNDCVDIRTASNKSIVGNGNTNFNITRSLANKLVSMDQILDGADVGWRVNEAHPPTYLGHKSPCHYDGGCIDAGLTSASVLHLNTFVEAARQVGLTAVWETSSAEATRLKNAGFKGTINANGAKPHFHITQ